jgi:hypothetical protein
VGAQTRHRTRRQAQVSTNHKCRPLRIGFYRVGFAKPQPSRDVQHPARRRLLCEGGRSERDRHINMDEEILDSWSRMGVSRDSRIHGLRGETLQRPIERQRNICDTSDLDVHTYAHRLAALSVHCLPGKLLYL